MVRVGPDTSGRTRVASDDEALLQTIAVDQALRPSASCRRRRSRDPQRVPTPRSG
jgi:hypothetical protein